MAQRNSPLRLRFEEGELTVPARRRTSARRASRFRSSYAGDPLEIGFNPEFLRDGLESVADDEVQLQADQPAAAGPDHGEGDDFWYLIMPIRLAG